MIFFGDLKTSSCIHVFSSKRTCFLAWIWVKSSCASPWSSWLHEGWDVFGLLDEDSWGFHTLLMMLQVLKHDNMILSDHELKILRFDGMNPTASSRAVGDYYIFMCFCVCLHGLNDGLKSQCGALNIWKLESWFWAQKGFYFFLFSFSAICRAATISQVFEMFLVVFWWNLSVGSI